MIENVFISVLEISLFTSPVILILIIFSIFSNKYYNSRWKYNAWIVIAIRLIIPVHINIPVKKFNINIPLQITSNTTANGSIKNSTDLSPGSPGNGITVFGIISCIWFTVFLILIFINLFSSLYYKIHITTKGIYVKDKYILKQVQILSDKLHIKYKIPVIKYSGALSPMAAGFFRPVLILPDLVYSKKELFFILKHELIHIKRHDIFFKFLFLTANALHWFNPFIYIMQKEAAANIELYCDETVIKGLSYNTRKAYTATLMSALCKQNKKDTKTILPVKFYGGVNIMKRRFKNILIKNKRKNGHFLFICTFTMVICPGIFTGCQFSQNFTAYYEKEKTAIQKTDNTFNNINNTNIINMETSINTQKESFLPANKNTAQNNNKTNNSKIVLSEDAIKIKSVVEKFSNAYFNGNEKSLKKFLAKSYNQDITLYTKTGKINNVTLKGLENINNEKDGKSCTVSLEFKDIKESSDSFLYLTVELIKQSGKWKINSYGLER